MKKETLLLGSLVAVILWPWLAVWAVGLFNIEGGYMVVWCVQGLAVEVVLLIIFFAFVKAVSDMEKEKEKESK